MEVATMKRWVRWFLPALVVLSLMTVAFAPLAQAEGPPNLSLEQLALLGTVGTAAIWALTVIYVGVFKQQKPKAATMKAIVFVGSVVLAFFWTPLTLPTFPIFAGEPVTFAMAILEWAGFLLAAAITIMKLAQLIFDHLWQPIMGWLDAKIVAPAAAKAAGKPVALYLKSFAGFLRPQRV